MIHFGLSPGNTVIALQRLSPQTVAFRGLLPGLFESDDKGAPFLHRNLQSLTRQASQRKSSAIDMQMADQKQ